MMVSEMRLTNGTVPDEPSYQMETFTRGNINVARNMVKELINSKTEHDTLEYILKTRKKEKEHFTIQTDQFTKVSGAMTENMVRAHIHMLHLVRDTLVNG